MCCTTGEIEEFESERKKYKNAHTPSSKKAGAGDREETTPQKVMSGATDSDSDKEESTGDVVAASDSLPRHDVGHKGTTRTPPEPEETLHVDEDYCPDCDQVFTGSDNNVFQIVINIPLSIPTTVVEYKPRRHECSCGNEIVAEHPDCPQTGRGLGQTP